MKLQTLIDGKSALLAGCIGISALTMFETTTTVGNAAGAVATSHETVNDEVVEWIGDKTRMIENIHPFNALPNFEESRFTDNQFVNMGASSIVRWELDIEGLPAQEKSMVLPILQKSLVWALNRDRRATFGKADENLVAILQHGSYSSANFGVLNERLYLARLGVVNYTDKSVQKLKVFAKTENARLLGPLLKGGVKLIFRARKVSLENVDEIQFSDFYGGTGGQLKELIVPPDWTVTGLNIYDSGDRSICRVDVVYEDPFGESYTYRFGSGPDEKLESLNLNDGVAKLEGRSDAELQFLEFTLPGNVNQSFGNANNGGPFPAIAINGKEIAGFAFHCGERIDGFRVVWR